MPKADLRLLFQQLIRTTRAEEISSILSAIGDSGEVGLDEELGDSGMMWHPVGDDPGNLSAINLATKPGRSLSERVTNAIDALLEKRAHTSPGPLPKNPREATRQWFGRPVSGPDQGLFNWDYSDAHDDRLIYVTLLESGREDAPTVDVLDAGIGITAAAFPNTILSLRGGNKISKFYLVGAFGQGGSSTLAFSDYAVYASRHVDDPSTVTFTLIKVLRLSDAYKEDCYVYLTTVGSKEPPIVPSFEYGTDGIELYDASDVKSPLWLHGTLVRHIGFKLSGLVATLSASPGNLYHYLHATLFDPLLPFRLLDLRRPGSEKNELVSGSRNRLMNYTKKGGDQPDKATSELRHYRPMEFVVPLNEHEATIGIEYWVVLNWRKPPKNSGVERILRPSSSELFVQHNYPVVGTQNGQNQGELSSSMFRKLNLPMVGRHIVVHIDVSRAPSHVRRVLFSSTREGFKDGPELSAIERVLATMLEEDVELAKLERDLAERLVQKESQKTEDEVKYQITKLLMDSGVVVEDNGKTSQQGKQESEPIDRKKRAPYKNKAPLPTLPYPEVTKWSIVAPAATLEVRIGDYETVLVETDGDAEFDRRGAVAIRSEPPVLEIGTKAPLSGGRVRWRMRATPEAVHGQEGKIYATITRPDGSQMISDRPFTVLTRPAEPAKISRGSVPPFEVLPIDPTNDADRERWGQLWPALAEEEDVALLGRVAYRVTAVGSKRFVYFNILFGPFRAMEDSFLLKGKSLGELFRVQYKVWIGYHALLQEADSADERGAASEDYVAQVLEEETIRVATMQAKQAAQFVELRKIAMRVSEDLAE